MYVNCVHVHIECCLLTCTCTILFTLEVLIYMGQTGSKMVSVCPMGNTS